MVRADIIRLYLRKNKVTVIAQEFHSSTRTVLKWIKYYKNENGNDKIVDSDKESILKKKNKLNLSKKPTKRKSSILKKFANFISKKCANKITGSQDNCSIRKLLILEIENSNLIKVQSIN